VHGVTQLESILFVVDQIQCFCSCSIELLPLMQMSFLIYHDHLDATAMNVSPPNASLDAIPHDSIFIPNAWDP
jgi:hypothetical protein